MRLRDDLFVSPSVLQSTPHAAGSEGGLYVAAAFVHVFHRKYRL